LIMTKSIPIQNIYYLLCYAWNKLDERDIVAVTLDDCKNIIDLFAKVLISATTHLFKRGLDRDYIHHHEDRSTLRGKIRFDPSLKRNLFHQGKAHCHFDDLHYDILHNQILKTTIHRLILNKSLDHDLKNQLIGLYRRFHGIEEIDLSSRVFRSVRLHRNNYFYDFPLRICELIYDNFLVAEGAGDVRFRDFLRDRRMWQLFQEFVRNFYRMEQYGFRVIGSGIKWHGKGLTEHASEMLPNMNTDITLKSRDKKIIIDTKFYKDALVTHHGKQMVRPDHLYQLFAYVKNDAGDDDPRRFEGMLLYPKVDDEPLDLQYKIHGHRISVRSINLNQEWRTIHQDLLALLTS
jgi:5-methylcytosine-specific restriction enzyme subunit McrC